MKWIKNWIFVRFSNWCRCCRPWCWSRCATWTRAWCDSIRWLTTRPTKNKFDKVIGFTTEIYLWFNAALDFLTCLTFNEAAVEVVDRVKLVLRWDFWAFGTLKTYYKKFQRHKNDHIPGFRFSSDWLRKNILFCSFCNGYIRFWSCTAQTVRSTWSFFSCWTFCSNFSF